MTFRNDGTNGENGKPQITSQAPASEIKDVDPMVLAQEIKSFIPSQLRYAVQTPEKDDDGSLALLRITEEERIKERIREELHDELRKKRDWEIDHQAAEMYENLLRDGCSKVEAEAKIKSYKEDRRKISFDSYLAEKKAEIDQAVESRLKFEIEKHQSQQVELTYGLFRIALWSTDYIPEEWEKWVLKFLTILPPGPASIMFAYLGCTPEGMALLFKPNVSAKVLDNLTQTQEQSVARIRRSRARLLESEPEIKQAQANIAKLYAKYPTAGCSINLLEHKYDRLKALDEGAVLTSAVYQLGGDGQLHMQVSWELMKHWFRTNFSDFPGIHFLGAARVFSAYDIRIDDKTKQEVKVPVDSSSTELGKMGLLKQVGVFLTYSGGMGGPFCRLRLPDGSWMPLAVSVGVAREEYQKFFDEMSPQIKAPIDGIVTFKAPEGQREGTNDERAKAAIERTLNGCLSRPKETLMPLGSTVLAKTIQGEDNWWDAIVQSAEGDFYQLCDMSNTIEVKCGDNGLKYRIIEGDTVRTGFIEWKAIPDVPRMPYDILHSKSKNKILPQILEAISAKPLPDGESYTLTGWTPGININIQLEVNANGQGLNYRTIRMDNSIRNGFIPWDKLPDDFPKDRFVISQQKDILLPHILQALSLKQNQFCTYDPAQRELKEEGVHVLHTGDKEIDTEKCQYVYFRPCTSGDKPQRHDFYISSFGSAIDAKKERAWKLWILPEDKKQERMAVFQKEAKNNWGNMLTETVAEFNKCTEGRVPDVDISTVAPYEGAHGLAMVSIVFDPETQRNFVYEWDLGLTCNISAEKNKLSESLLLSQYDFDPYIKSTEARARRAALVAAEKAPKTELPAEVWDLKVRLREITASLSQATKDNIDTYQKILRALTDPRTGQPYVPLHRDLTARNMMLAPEVEACDTSAIKLLQETNPGLTEEEAVTRRNFQRALASCVTLPGETSEGIQDLIALQQNQMIITRKTQDPEVLTFCMKGMTLFNLLPKEAKTGQDGALTNEGGGAAAPKRARYLVRVRTDRDRVPGNPPPPSAEASTDQGETAARPTESQSPSPGSGTENSESPRPKGP